MPPLESVVLDRVGAATFFGWHTDAEDRLKGADTGIQAARFLGSVRSDFWK